MQHTSEIISSSIPGNWKPPQALLMLLLNTIVSVCLRKPLNSVEADTYSQ